ncbi:MAG: DNA-binding response regulator [Halobacteriovoraceae bacterium]|nr:DNA-binding response regulator [Halobacteriovoraceae bacterium]
MLYNSSMSYRILIIEDDADISEVLRLQLELKQYQPIVASSYLNAQKAMEGDKFDLFLIDRMLPDASGLDICRYLRNHETYESTPIILITAMAEPENIVEGLDAGADDYITKPFDINILHARVRAHLRRLESNKKTGDLQIGPLSLNMEKCEVKNEGDLLQLTNTEFQILCQLFENPGVVYSREKLIAKILGDEVHVTNRTIDTHIAGLRKKLGSASNQIETIRGVGYRLREEA